MASLEEARCPGLTGQDSPMSSSNDEGEILLLPQQKSKLRQGRLGKVVLASLLVAGAAVLLFGRWAPAKSLAERAAVGDGTLALDEVDEVDEEEATEECSMVGKDCSKSKCCEAPGLQCYQKNEDWSSCRRECTAGRDPVDPDPKEWTCKPLGHKKPGPPPLQNFSLKAAPWVEEECSASGEDCSKTKCCKEQGAQCYKKADGWAACKAFCTPGPDPTDGNSDPWECKALGMRTPGAPIKSVGETQKWVADECSSKGESCLKSGCCKDPGHQCFKKHDTWAACMDKCTPGPLLTDKEPGMWNCTALGGRTPGYPKVPANVKVAPWVKEKCSKDGENCEDTRCCADATMQCYAKAPGWAACMNSCKPGVHPGDKSGGAWSCNPLGPRTPRPWGKPSLYCFSVIMLSTYEAAIIRQALDKGGLGIFACELYDVFSQEGETVLGDGPLGEVRTHHFVPAKVTKSVDGTAGNAKLFVNVWEAVRAIGAYELTDWTIKADPDAVIFPNKLRGHLAKPTFKATFIINCNKPGMSTGPMMFGSLEAITKGALQKYFASAATLCNEHWDFGEDRWLGACLKDKLGVQPWNDFGMVGDNVCTGGDCADGQHAVYHPFKSATAWIGCYYAAMR